jgi:tRNA(Ile)-lysidine synthase
MALLRLAAVWRDMPQGPQHVYALTVDHELRAGSAAEAAQVASWCAEIAVEHHILNWTGDRPETGLQAKARTARYDLMSAWCRTHAVPMLMTAHTADDQAETVMMRQKRTDTDRSLAAIWPENEWRGVKLFRPLLSERRQALRNYLDALGQGWLDDPSNTNERFERVRIRGAMRDADVSTLAAIAGAAQLRVRVADDELGHWRREFMAVDDYAVVRFSRGVFQQTAAAFKIDILALALRLAGDGQVPERAVVESICQWIAEGRENRRSANGAIVSARRNVIEVMREPARMRHRFTEVGSEGLLEFDGRYLIKAPPGALVGPMGLPPLLKRPKDVPAFAFSALPLVKLADGTLVSAVKSGHSQIFATLCERFRQ